MRDWFFQFSETTLGKIVAIGVFVLFCVIYIMSYTSVGKRALKELRLRAIDVDKKVKQYKEELESQYKKFEEKQNEKLAEAKAENAELKEFIATTLKFVNNKKVKESVKKFEAKQIPTESEKVAE